MKPTKAWAIARVRDGHLADIAADGDGNAVAHDVGRLYLYKFRERAELCRADSELVIRVEIRELPKRRTK